MSTLALPAVAAPPSRRTAVRLAVLAGAGVALLLHEWSATAFLAWTTLGFAAIAARSFAGRRFDAADALQLFTLYYVLSLLVRAVGVVAWVDSPYLRELGDGRSAHVRDLAGWSQLVAGLGLFAVQEGHDGPVGGRWAAALARRMPALAAPWRDGATSRAVLVLAALGVLGAVLRVHDLGGFMRAAANPMAAGTDEALGHWWQIALTEFAVVALHVHLVRLLLRGDRHFALHWLVLSLGLSVPLYLVSSSKSILLRTLLLPWVYRHLLAKRIPMWRVIVALAAFSALFPLFYAYRALGISNLDAVGLYLQNADSPPILRMFNRAYGADSLMLVLHRTGTTLPFRWGASLLDLGTFWVPRLLWPGKPDSFGLQFPAAYMPDMHWGAMTYVTTSLPGELYLNFHVVGVLAGSWLLGAAMRASRVLARGGPGGVLLHGYGLITAVHLAEGCIASQLESWLTDLLPALLAVAWITARTRRARRTEAA